MRKMTAEAAKRLNKTLQTIREPQDGGVPPKSPEKGDSGPSRRNAKNSNDSHELPSRLRIILDELQSRGRKLTPDSLRRDAHIVTKMNDGASQAGVGRDLGVTRQRVNQIVVNRLREALSKRRGLTELDNI